MRRRSCSDAAAGEALRRERPLLARCSTGERLRLRRGERLRRRGDGERLRRGDGERLRRRELARGGESSLALRLAASALLELAAELPKRWFETEAARSTGLVAADVSRELDSDGSMKLSGGDTSERASVRKER